MREEKRVWGRGQRSRNLTPSTKSFASNFRNVHFPTIPNDSGERQKKVDDFIINGVEDFFDAPIQTLPIIKFVNLLEILVMNQKQEDAHKKVRKKDLKTIRSLNLTNDIWRKTNEEIKEADK